LGLSGASTGKSRLGSRTRKLEGGSGQVRRSDAKVSAPPSFQLALGTLSATEARTSHALVPPGEVWWTAPTRFQNV